MNIIIMRSDQGMDQWRVLVIFLPKRKSSLPLLEKPAKADPADKSNALVRGEKWGLAISGPAPFPPEKAMSFNSSALKEAA
jgi:hypothetical protein